MNVLPSIEFMASTTSVSAASVFGFGSSSPTASTASQWPLSLKTRYSVRMHGELSPELQHLDQIRQIEMPVDVPDQGLLCDLPWSDPDREIKGWGENDRGVSYTFGADIIVSEFLRKHDFDLICRAHQVVEDAWLYIYEFFADRQLVTIFSATNYHGEFNNAGALMSVDASSLCSFQILKPCRGKVGGQLD